MRGSKGRARPLIDILADPTTSAAGDDLPVGVTAIEGELSQGHITVVAQAPALEEALARARVAAAGRVGILEVWEAQAVNAIRTDTAWEARVVFRKRAAKGA